MADIELTDDERRAIASLKRRAKRWPSTLWLFAGGSIDKVAILRTQDDGKRAMGSDQGVDRRYIVDHVAIPNDGGDW